MGKVVRVFNRWTPATLPAAGRTTEGRQDFAMQRALPSEGRIYDMQGKEAAPYSKGWGWLTETSGNYRLSY